MSDVVKSWQIRWGLACVLTSMLGSAVPVPAQRILPDDALQPLRNPNPSTRDEAAKELVYKMQDEVKVRAKQVAALVDFIGCTKASEFTTRENRCRREIRASFRCDSVGMISGDHRVSEFEVEGYLEEESEGFLTRVTSTIPTGKLAAPPRATREPSPAPKPSPQPGKPEDCRVVFSTLPGWSTVVRDDAASCELGLRPKGWAKIVRESEVALDDPPLSIRVWRDAFLTTAASEGFDWRLGYWVVYGRMGSESQAEIIHGTHDGDWVGLRGEPSVGMHYKRGGYAGLGDTIRVLIQNRDGRLVAIDADAFGWEAAEKMITTLRFLEESP